MWEYLKRPQSRRSALKTFGIGGVGLASLSSLATLVGCNKSFLKSSKWSRMNVDDLLRDSGPIDRLPHDSREKIFSGDQPARPHSILWDKPGYFAKRNFKPSTTAVTSEVPLVIVGAGVSGLLSAYLLRDYKPLVLEQAVRFGGNSKGENYNGLDYSIGAAYFTVPDEGTPDAKLLQEIGADKLWKVKLESDPCWVQGKVYDEFWNGDSAPTHRKQFQKLNKYFADLCNEKNGMVFPEIPVTTAEVRKVVERLDRETFIDHVKKIAGEKLHPHVETAIEQYCWSSFAASSTEISAAMGLNFYAGEFGPVAVPPGGNAAIAECILKKTAEVVPIDRLRTGCLVFDVRQEEGSGGKSVLVSFENPQGEIECVRARAVVMACPKFVVKRVLDGIEPDREKAITKLRYNSYLVANVLLKKKISRRFYDLFMLGQGQTNMKDIRSSANSRKVTDVVLADYASPDSEMSALSLYRAFPYAGARGELYAPNSYDRFRPEFEKQIADEILPALGMNATDVADLRLTRWGHPLPVAAQGLIADGTIAKIRKPWRERVFFVEQDNWMLPAFETALGEALRWAPEVKKVLV